MAPSAALKPAGDGENAPIRLMIVDDSIVVRSVLGRLLEPSGEFVIAASCKTAAEALERLETLSVDIILLDVEMPGMDGITALPRLIEKSGGARILMVSANCESGGEAEVRALTLGAAETLPKPGVGAFHGRFAQDLSERLRRLAKPLAADAPRPSQAPSSPVLPQVSGPLECVAIGASTGGLHALSAFFQVLPRSMDAPILITQHLPTSFMPYFAAQMRDITGRPCRVAEEGDRLVRGEILIAPGDGHLCVQRSVAGVRVAIARGPAASGCLPSVDPMLDSVCEVYGPAAMAVVLTGMGRDGTLAAARLAGVAEILVQDSGSSVIWGMPGSIARAGYASGVLRPEAIAARVAHRHATQR